MATEPMETCAGVALAGAVFTGVDADVDDGVVAGADVSGAAAVLAACSRPLLLSWVGALLLMPTAAVGAKEGDAADDATGEEAALLAAGADVVAAVLVVAVLTGVAEDVVDAVGEVAARAMPAKVVRVNAVMMSLFMMSP